MGAALTRSTNRAWYMALGVTPLSLFLALNSDMATPSIRFLVSVQMLISALVAVALAAIVLVLLAALADGPSSEDIRVSADALARLDALERALHDGEIPDPVLAQLRADLAAHPQPLADLAALETAVAARLRHRHTAPIFGEDPESTVLDADLRTADYHLRSSLRLLARPSSPWLDSATRWGGPITAVVTAFAFYTVYGAWALRRRLSDPLERLSDAAEAVARGEFDVPLPPAEGASELRRLSIGVRAARDQLVDTIADLSQQRRRASIMIEAVGDGILLVDGFGRILEANPAASRILPGIGLGLPLGDVLPELVEAALPPEFSDTQAVAMPYVEVERGNAQSRQVLCAWRLALPGSRQEVVVVRDETRLRAVDQLKRDFLSVITHELKTPLTSIEGYAKLLALGKGGTLSDKQLGFVRIIRDQADTLKTMVQNLLDTTRLEGGSLPIDPAPTAVGELLRRCGDTMRAAVEEKGIRLTVESAALDGVMLSLDPFRMQQVLGNLVSNASKFTPPGGEIALTGEVTQVAVLLRVCDTGRGIPADALPRIFDKFYQVESGDTRVAGGAGLGLTIVKGLVDAQGGSIRAESQVGIGTTFILSWPRP